MNDFYIGVGAKVFKNDNTKVLFTYEYTWQNFRLGLLRLVNNCVESIYKTQKL